MSESNNQDNQENQQVTTLDQRSEQAPSSHGGVISDSTEKSTKPTKSNNQDNQENQQVTTLDQRSEQAPSSHGGVISDSTEKSTKQTKKELTEKLSVDSNIISEFLLLKIDNNYRIFLSEKDLQTEFPSLAFAHGVEHTDDDKKVEKRLFSKKLDLSKEPYLVIKTTSNTLEFTVFEHKTSTDELFDIKKDGIELIPIS